MNAALESQPKAERSSGFTWGTLFQKGGIWIGAHYSVENRRWCINLLPCCTIWIALPNGRPPKRVKELK